MGSCMVGFGQYGGCFGADGELGPWGSYSESSRLDCVYAHKGRGICVNQGCSV